MESKYKNWLVIISILVPVIVAVLIYKPVTTQYQDSWVVLLPHINAFINATTSVLLLLGLYFVKNTRVDYHKICMLSAFLLGCLFLVGYIIYHSTVPSTSFGGQGLIRYVYYPLLISHILLAIIVVPFVLLALYHALKDNVEKHKKVVKIAYPVWLYVSITGVLVYLMISPYYG